MRTDPEKVEAAIAAMIEEMKPALAVPGVRGTLARMQTMVTPAVLRWRSSEVNRGTDPNDIANALVGLISSTLVAEATAVYGMEPTYDHYNFINSMLQGIAEEFGSMLNGAGGIKMKSVAMDVAGTC